MLYFSYVLSMSLSALLPTLQGLPGYQRLLQELDNRRVARAFALEEAKPALLTLLQTTLDAPLLVVTPTGARANALAEQLQIWVAPDIPVLLFPEPDVLPYEQLEPDLRLLQQRLSVLQALSSLHAGGGQPPIVVTSIGSLALGTPTPEAFAAATTHLAPGQRVAIDRLTANLLMAGYQQVATVERPGQFARRGGILDCYPTHRLEPFRLDLWGDDIDTIRSFDPVTQRSEEELAAVSVPPAREVLGQPWSPAPPALTLDDCTPDARSILERDLAQLSEGGTVEHPWLLFPLFSSGSLLDYLPQHSVAVLEEPQDLPLVLHQLSTEATALRDGLIKQRTLPANFPEAYEAWEQIEIRLREQLRSVELRRWGGEDDDELGLEPAPSFGGRLQGFLTEMEREVRQGSRVVIVSHQSQRLAELLTEREVYVQPREYMDALPEPGSVALIQGSLPGGWKLPANPARPEGERSALALLTDAEIFGFVKQQRRQGTKRRTRQENPLMGIHAGDLVVHIEHGIGRFVATVTLEEAPDVAKEYLLLEYADGGRLYVPTEQVDRVARYIGPGDHAPALNRLGTQEWERAKERVHKAAQLHAKELLGTMAARQVTVGTAFSPDTLWQQELEASFPYLETPDQLQAVQDVKSDMEQTQPMDRLVCGDVGYGKTEVAIRAAFKAVQEGAQVAMLVPTTVLAQQHYQTVTQRLSAFPVKVEVLSRFRSEEEQRQVLGALHEGRVDILIGTHRLLQKDVLFKNLGLVVVDEEQRFGVLHKEHFKRLRQEVDVLTLTATPIPRTLYMALVGVRDMSAMETPPEERLPIKTYVMDYNEEIIRHAVLRELERGGQVFFVHNRVQSIAQQAFKLRDLIPEASVGVAHGQMSEEGLERTMQEFSSGQLDVLVCSTIIESGLDLPNVNTIIINDADKLGLAQLYQLRGRVGRGTHRAYAYLLYPRNKVLTERAQKRLQAVFEATDLGAGYFIAMKDLEIRGAGNLLGVEQSGQVGAVGFDLYCRILAAAVETAKAELEGRPVAATALPTPQAVVNLKLTAYLPEDYVQDLDVRLELYRRLATLREPEVLEELAQELHDRFGRPPAVVENLLYIVRVKLLAAAAGVASIERNDDMMVIRMQEGRRIDRRPLENLPGVQPGNNQLRIISLGRQSRWQPLLEGVLERIERPAAAIS